MVHSHRSKRILKDEKNVDPQVKSSSLQKRNQMPSLQVKNRRREEKPGKPLKEDCVPGRQRGGVSQVRQGSQQRALGDQAHTCR